MRKDQEFYEYNHEKKSEEKFVIDENVAEVIADRLIGSGITKSSSEVILKFPIPEEKYDAELALRSLDMALALNDLSMQRSYHKYEEDKNEYAFWERFSKEVNNIIEDRGLFNLVIERMI